MQENEISKSEYAEPVSQLLTMGDCRGQTEWLDYLALGLGSEQIPDLIRMVEDDELHWADQESLEVWAPVHAWRALGQLGAEAAVEPLLGLLWRIEELEDDWVGEEIPVVLGMIGPAAVPKLAEFLADPLQGLWARVAAAHALAEVGKRHPDARDDCVAVLSGALDGFADHDPSLNALLINYLVDLKAVEAAPQMEKAFAADSGHFRPGRLGGCPDRIGLAGRTPDPCTQVFLVARARPTGSDHGQGSMEAGARGRASPKKQAKGQAETSKESAP